MMTHVSQGDAVGLSTRTLPSCFYQLVWRVTMKLTFVDLLRIKDLKRNPNLNLLGCVQCQWRVGRLLGRELISSHAVALRPNQWALRSFYKSILDQY